MINAKNAEIVIRDNEIIVRDKHTQNQLGFLDKAKLSKILNLEVENKQPNVVKKAVVSPNDIVTSTITPMLPKGCKSYCVGKYGLALLIEKSPMEIITGYQNRKSYTLQLPYTQYIVQICNVGDKIKPRTIAIFCSKKPISLNDKCVPCILENTRGDGSVCLGYDVVTRKYFEKNQIKECFNYLYNAVFSNTFSGMITDDYTSIYKDKAVLTQDQIIQFSIKQVEKWIKLYYNNDVLNKTFEQLLLEVVNNKYSFHWNIR